MSLGKGVILSYTEVGGGGSSSCNFRPEVVRASNSHNSVALPTYPPYHGFGMVGGGAYSAIGAGCSASSLAQPTYYNLGVVYSEKMQYDMALTFYERAATERPMYAEAYCNMGEIFKNRSDLGAAITCYESSFGRILSSDLRRIVTSCLFIFNLSSLANWKVKLEGDIIQGVAFYKKALYYNWHYADAMYNLGVAYGEMLKFDMAIVFYELEFHLHLWESVLCCINEAWRRYKCKIKSEHFLKYSSLRERLRHRPTMIPEPHFRQLMSYWSNTTVQVCHFVDDYYAASIVIC
ncbi:hypothetical protein RIF29_09266 [Crotalaria pallida]|uniref:UDP-N-acetylglucosamine--peptide N-acetylglucosaminyltransferase SPINDLY n=1 Tax=Crotalaria pallida TaxID=3830 RepID=A0AAN9FRQ5_CROPI